MVARPEELVQHLFSADSSTKLKAVREVKNQIIGNKSKKLSYIKLGVVPRVVELLASEAESNYLKVQSAAAVGSFAYGVDDGLRAVMESGGVVSLVKALYSPDEKVVEAAVRSLKMIYQSSNPPPAQVLDAKAVERLVTLLEASNHCVSESAAVLLATAAKEPNQRSLVSSRGGIQGLLKMLLHGEKTGKEAAMGALATLCAGDNESARQVASKQEVIQSLLQMLKDSKAETRFTAAACLTSLANCMQQQHNGDDNLTEKVQRAVLPVLVKLLGCSDLAEEIPQVLYDLIAQDEALQQAASDADAITKLALFLQDDEKCSDKLKEGAYRALGSLCMNSEEAKKQLQDSSVLSSIVKSVQRGMSGASSSLRAAACACLRALSRSQTVLLKTIDTKIALQLVRLLGDSDYNVQAAASAALTNILLNFSPAREVVLQEGGLSSITCLVHSMDATLRLNGVWALQNLLYGPHETQLRKAVMAELMWEDVKVLLDDPEQQVQEKALCLLRNLLYDGHPVIQAVMDWSHNELLSVVAQKLEPALSVSSSVRMHALYVMVNSAAGSESHKEAVMKCGAVQHFEHYLRSPTTQHRVAVLWVLINLSNSEGNAEGASRRVVRFTELGLQERLMELQNDEDLSVKERVKTVLDQFRRAP